jgi:hypothetical protein
MNGAILLTAQGIKAASAIATKSRATHYIDVKIEVYTCVCVRERVCVFVCVCVCVCVHTRTHMYTYKQTHTNKLSLSLTLSLSLSHTHTHTHTQECRNLPPVDMDMTSEAVQKEVCTLESPLHSELYITHIH